MSLAFVGPCRVHDAVAAPALQDARAFLADFRSGYYEHSKLANVLFGYELQRRLGVHGVTSCVADPGGVRSNIWDKSPIFKKGIKK